MRSRSEELLVVRLCATRTTSSDSRPSMGKLRPRGQTYYYESERHKIFVSYIVSCVFSHLNEALQKSCNFALPRFQPTLKQHVFYISHDRYTVGPRWPTNCPPTWSILRPEDQLTGVTLPVAGLLIGGGLPDQEGARHDELGCSARPGPRQQKIKSHVIFQRRCGVQEVSVALSVCRSVRSRSSAELSTEFEELPEVSSSYSDEAHERWAGRSRLRPPKTHPPLLPYTPLPPGRPLPTSPQVPECQQISYNKAQI